MYPSRSPSNMSPEDVRTLCDLAGRYGSGSLETTLRNISGSNYTSLRPPPQHHHRNPHHMDAPARNSALSTSTFGSNNSAPSLTNSAGPWSSSDASFCGSDAASLSGSYFSQQPGGAVSAATWADAADAPFLMSPSVTPSLSGSEWQDHHINEHHLSSTSSREKKAATSMKSPSSGAVAGRKPIECPMCAVHDVYVGFGRKSDFKKHLQNFHNTDFIWVCPQDNCRMIFDFEKAYIAHVKLDHHQGEAAYPPAAAIAAAEQVKVGLCAQVVFACGFIGCKEVFEASDDSETPKTADAYFDHLASHFDKRSSTINANSSSCNLGVSSEWTYYHQMQNLLRQRSLKDEWKHMLWDKAARNQLRWQPRSSGDLKKLLECRHLADVPRILHAAWTLGQTCFSSPEHPAPEFPGEATRPVRSRCPLAGEGRNHGELRDSPSAMTMFALRRNLFPVKLATVSHPPPRSIPEEPDSLAYPHPGTPLVIPERDAWSTDVVLGPPEDEQLFDPMFMPGSGATTNMLQNPISPWIDAMSQQQQHQQQRRSFGDFSRHLTPSPQPTEDQESSFGPLLQVPQPTSAAAPKRPRSWGMRSLENLRLKRRGRSSPVTSPVEEKALPGWI
ncbi:hypothetical protein BDP55DRAFT_604302 [Colletotrichum godetiae]|uniref:C2H2-type domain-containing protein n=1 Tax=Colletotrichum godetiae TaxID=1209918 RepID=A0AAJ0F1A2_9PEZI|nr:uncharacterized protein BDP55DRAFT_604302 [Colletotrichum godetiae]KAK1689338.1 hypothetical protein BDP55DRAFT_604302 [Colletotrichum godetiae]